MTHANSKARLARYVAIATGAVALPWMLWSAIGGGADERVHDNIRTVPVVGNDLDELLPFGSVYAKFTRHPHGSIRGVLSGRCSEEAFREIAQNWNMEPLDGDAVWSSIFLEKVPERYRRHLTPSNSDYGGDYGSRMIDKREVRLRGAFIRDGGGYVLEVRSSF